MKKLLLMCTILIVGLTSCLQDFEPGGKTTVKGKNDVTLKFVLPLSTVVTRGIAAEEGENEVHDLTLLLFEPTKNASGKFKGFYKVASADLPQNNAEAFEVNVAFDLITGLTKTDGYNILAMGNMVGTLFTNDQELDEFLNEAVGLTETEVSQKAILNINDGGYSADSDDAFKSELLPMSARATKAEGEDEVELKLTRTVTRFDIINKASGYELVSASVWNAASKSAVWDNVNGDYSLHTKRFYGVVTGTNIIMGGLYGVENVSSNPDQNDDKTTCLIIGLLKEGDPNTHFYRLNIHSKEMGQYLRRNSVYQTTIKAVNGDGENNEKDAYTNGKFELDTSINSWDRDEDGLIMRDGDNLLALPTRKAVFGPAAEKRQYFVYTMGTGTLEMMKLNMPSGLNAWLEGNNLFIEVEAFSGEQRKGSIELRFAGMKGVIEIVQGGTTAKHLTLNYTNIPIYPSGSPTSMLPNGNPLRISSSGPWTATIMGGTDFTFTIGTDDLVYTGVDGTMISNIYSRRANAQAKSVTNFVLFTLDADPENYRNVIVLTQSGAGNFTLVPNNTAVNFSAGGALAMGSGNTNTFKVIPGQDSDLWEVRLTGGDASKFQLTSPGKAPGFSLSFSGYDGLDQAFTIEPIGANTSAADYQTMVEITHNTQNKKFISVTQGHYTFSVSTTSLNLKGEGGEVKFTVNSNATDRTVNAVLGDCTYPTVQPLFTLNNSKTISGQPFGTLSVTVPPILVNTINNDPTTTITISVEGTDLSQTFTIKQEKITFPTSLQYQTCDGGYYGSWDSGHRFEQWPAYLSDPLLFGPTGTVWASSVYTKNASGATIGSNVRMYCMNNRNAAEDLYTSAIKNNDKFVAVLTDFHNSTIFRQIGLKDQFTTIAPSNNSSARTFAGIPQSVKDTKLWEYLMNGPFGTVNPNNVSLKPSDGNIAVVTKWPSTFIPLMYVPGSTTQVIFGIDPTNQVVWVGDSEMFHNYNNNYASTNVDNIRFLKNVLAYCVHVNLYGNAFNNQFKIK